ncbi:MAG TPA: cation-transporting P-type ATPase, partial [Candidatus Acetothermia bacterium]|nr:cation-transporting P-type ATPase [Candidatus Acetothermia bacterium]
MEQSQEPKHWHALDDSDAFAQLQSSPQGLPDDEAKRRLSEVGSNTLAVETETGAWRLIAHQLHNPLIYLLMGAAVLSFLAGKALDASVILGVILLNTVLGFVQEWRAEGALAALR